MYSCKRSSKFSTKIHTVTLISWPFSEQPKAAEGKKSQNIENSWTKKNNFLLNTPHVYDIYDIYDIYHI